MKRKILLILTTIILLSSICLTTFACKSKVYTVQFKTNGASAIADVKVNSGDKLTLPTSPTIEHYNFLGWFLDDKLTQPFSIKTAIKSDLILYAKWEIAEHEHQFGAVYIEDGFERKKCKICNFVSEVKLPVGLQFTLNEKDNTYTLTSVGILEDNEYIKDKKIIIPSIYEGKSVTTIGKMAFNNCALISVTIPNSIISIEDSAFSSCKSLTNVTFGDDCAVALLGENIFFNCSALTTINLEKVTKIKALPKGFFSGCSALISVTLPNNITTLGDNLFYDCANLATAPSLQYITKFGKGVFSGCKSLTSVTLPTTITSISASLFEGCINLASVVIPQSVTIIGVAAFQNCKKLAAIILPCNIKSINASAFENCVLIKNVIFPITLTSIGANAFASCTALTTFYFKASELPLSENLGRNWNGGVTNYIFDSILPIDYIFNITSPSHLLYKILFV